MAKKSSNIQVNGRILKITTELEDGSYSVTYKGEEIGTGNAQGGGGFIIKSNAATREVLSNAEGGVDALQPKLYGAIENENKAILNKNASKTQKLNLRDLGYGNKLNIPGLTTPPAPEQTETPTPPAGSTQQPAATAADAGAAATGGADQSLIQDASGGADQLAKLFFGDLRYPLERQETRDYDHVLFSAVEYVPAGEAGFAAIISEGGAATGRPSTRMKKENRVGSIMLPMPRNYNDQNAVTWGQDQLNALQAAGNTLIQGILGSGDQVNQAVDNVRSAVGTNAGQLKDYLKAGAASQILGGANILTRTTGAVMNSNLELLFTGPGLRTFNFTYRMTPREPQEAAECRNIIRSFKQAMAARIRSASLFMYTPHVFFIDFIHKGQPHPFFNRIKPCALLNFGVNYTPDGAYMTYEDGSPIAYELTFSFQELEPIYDVDYEEGDAVSGMGF